MSDHQTILCQDFIIMEYYPMIVGYSGPDFFRIWLCVQTLVPKRYLPWMDVYPPSQIVHWDQTNIKPISGIETYTLIKVFMEKKLLFNVELENAGNT